MTALAFGFLAGGNPCALPLYPGFLAYVAARSQALKNQRGEFLLGLCVIAGVLVSMLVFGAIVVWLRISFLSFLSIVDPLINLLLLAVGILLALNIRIVGRVPGIRLPRTRNPFMETFAYGLLYGPLTLPCNLPLVLSIVAFSFTAYEALDRLLVFVFFGIGLGFPLIALPALVSARRRWLIQALARRYELVSRFAGVLLIAVALYGLIVIPAYLAGLFT